MVVNVSLVGNVGRDPETRTFQNGNSLTTFSVGVSQGYFDQSRQWQDQGTMWVDVECITPQAKAQLPWVVKGARVHITGLLQQRFFTKKDGAQGSSLKVAAQALSFLHKKDEQQMIQPAGYAPAAPASAQTGDPWAGGGYQSGEPDF